MHIDFVCGSTLIRHCYTPLALSQPGSCCGACHPQASFCCQLRGAAFTLLSAAALVYTTWRLCPRAARYCRSPLTDAGTRQRSCKLPQTANAQPMQSTPMQSTDQPLTGLILPPRAALTASITKWPHHRRSRLQLKHHPLPSRRPRLARGARHPSPNQCTAVSSSISIK